MVVLSVREREEEMIAALDNGADDYVTKPFRTGELLARLRVAQRHKHLPPGSPVFRSGGLEVDLNTRVVKVNGSEVRLTPIEYSLLSLFVQHPRECSPITTSSAPFGVPTPWTIPITCAFTSPTSAKNWNRILPAPPTSKPKPASAIAWSKRIENAVDSGP